MKHTGKHLLAIAFGAAVMGFGVNYFNLANGLAEGGVTGVTLLLKYTLNLDPGTMNIALNLPLFIAGWKILGRRTFFYSLYGTGMLSLFLWAFSGLRLPLNDSLLAALYAGVTFGFGLGIIFRYGGTTGGTDIIARLLNRWLGWSMGRTLFMLDMLVLAASLYYLDKERAMYTLVAVFIGARVIDIVQQAAYSAKAAMIISDSAPAISKAILNEMERGATLLKSRGGYTGSEKEVLYCVVSRNELIRLKSLVRAIDPHAFVIVNDVQEVLGEGFTLDENKKPLL